MRFDFFLKNENVVVAIAPAIILNLNIPPKPMHLRLGPSLVLLRSDRIFKRWSLRGGLYVYWRHAFEKDNGTLAHFFFSLSVPGYESVTLLYHMFLQ
jgi:hypothetical protein